MLSYEEKASECMKNEEYSKAINYYTLCINNGEATTKAYSGRATAYYHNCKQSNSSDSTSQMRKVAKDCQDALKLDAQNYEASYYLGLSYSEMKDKGDKGLKIIQEAYQKSLSNAKTYKHYTLPQKIYVTLTTMMQDKRLEKIKQSVTASVPLFDKVLRVREAQYHQDIDTLTKNKRVSSKWMQLAKVKLAERYHRDVENLVDIFSRGCPDLAIDLEPPLYLCDPISFHLFLEPMVTPSGHSYEKSWLLQHLEKHDYDPLTRQKIQRDQCYPNYALKQCVDNYLQSKALS